MPGLPGCAVCGVVLTGTVTGGASAGGVVDAALNWVETWGASPVVAADVDDGEPGIEIADVLVVVGEVTGSWTGSMCPGAGGTVDASARVNPNAAATTITTAAARLTERARTFVSLAGRGPDAMSRR